MTVPADGGLSKKGGPRAWWAVGAAAVLVAAVIIGTLVLTDDDDKEIVASDQSTTSSSTSSTSSSSTSSTSVADTSTTVPADTTTSLDTTDTTGAELDTSTVVFPDPDTAERFDDPVAATQAFATGVIGFTDPVLGAYVAGPDSAGVVEVRPAADGPVTTVSIVELADGNWWVQQATTENIVLDEPTPAATITSPVTLAGSALAFEGTVQVALWERGGAAPLAETFVTGGGDAMAPFEGTLEFPAPTSTDGMLVLSTESAEDGSVLEAVVVKVGFG
ncbi:MAG: Gmad2 immunoglobulin-like domain-containing protein [Actinomycetota bacterium]|nr:Gmad2 immunoglobulin-like domain-containing protein [Actinomycetota bacterium]